MPRLHLPAFVASLLALTAPLPAFAHAILLASSPAASGSVASGPAALELRFNSRIDKGRSALRLIAADRSERVLPIAADGPPDVLQARTEMGPGRYVLRWQVLAIDGHITRGEVPFTVAAETLISVTLLVDLFGYLSVVIHGLVIVAQSMAVGGALFLVLAARPWTRVPLRAVPPSRAGWRGSRAGARSG